MAVLLMAMTPDSATMLCQRRFQSPGNIQSSR